MPRQKKYRILTVGVTGGIGSGKSSVCKFFEKLGVKILYADNIARELTESHEGIKKQIRKIFGSEVFSHDGQLNRKKLADLVFSNQKLKEQLNAIVHPYVFKVIEKEIRKVEQTKSSPFVIHEAALIYESGADEDLDYVIVVDADEDTRIQRVMKRDNVTREKVLQRINSQMPVEEKRTRADFVVKNNGDIKSLERKVKFLYYLLLRLKP